MEESKLKNKDLYQRMVNNCFFLNHKDCDYCKYQYTCDAHIELEKIKQYEKETKERLCHSQ